MTLKKQKIKRKRADFLFHDGEFRHKVVELKKKKIKYSLDCKEAFEDFENGQEPKDFI